MGVIASSPLPETELTARNLAAWRTWRRATSLPPHRLTAPSPLPPGNPPPPLLSQTHRPTSISRLQSTSPHIPSRPLRTLRYHKARPPVLTGTPTRNPTLNPRARTRLSTPRPLKSRSPAKEVHPLRTLPSLQTMSRTNSRATLHPLTPSGTGRGDSLWPK